jgi:hypothetical protein
MPLSDDAKKELNEAIRIVREDRFEAYVRKNHAAPPNPNPNDPPKDPPTDPPPPKNDPNDPPNDPPPANKHSYWGELGID